jgi:hypothetical protein
VGTVPGNAGVETSGQWLVVSGQFKEIQFLQILNSDCLDRVHAIYTDVEERPFRAAL